MVGIAFFGAFWLLASVIAGVLWARIAKQLRQEDSPFPLPEINFHQRRQRMR